MDAKSLTWALSTSKENAQGKELVSIFGDVSQSEILSKIHPPLGTQFMISFNKMAGAESMLDLPFNYCCLDINYYIVCSRVGSLIGRVPSVSNETRGHWSGLCSLSPRPSTPPHQSGLALLIVLKNKPEIGLAHCLLIRNPKRCQGYTYNWKTQKPELELNSMIPWPFRKLFKTILGKSMTPWPFRTFKGYS